MGITAHPIFSDLSPDQLAAAVEENLIALIQQFGLLGEYREDCPPGVKRSITTLPASLLNAIVGAQLDPDQVGVTIEWITADARARGIPLAWLTGPLTQPADLGVRLEAHGFTNDGTEDGMAVDLANLNEPLPAPAGFTVRQMCDEAGWRLWTDTNARIWWGGQVTNYEDDSWCRIFRAANPKVMYAYVGYLSGQPVASSLMLLGAGVAGLYLVGTFPDVRRRGIGTRMCLEPLLEARRQGYGIGVLESTAMGLNVYRQLGFKELCPIHFYSWKP